MAPRLKFIGQEDLVNGNRATFFPEERFNGNGTKSGNFRRNRNLRKEPGDDTSLRRTGDGKEFPAGMKYRMGQYFIPGAIDRAKIDSPTIENGHAWKVAPGYGYDMSRWTRLYANPVYIDSSNTGVGKLCNGNGVSGESMSGIRTGILHTFRCRPVSLMAERGGVNACRFQAVQYA